MSCRWFIVLLAIGFASGICRAGGGSRQTLDYAPSPVDNPLKGLVPYAGAWENLFPHSLEFNYLPLASLVTMYELYDWTPLEKLLDDCAARGHQVVFRIYLEYPGREDGIPAFLIHDGLKVYRYRDLASTPPTDNATPDYGDAKLRKVLKEFIAALGKKYDGDPRIGFISAGLLGYWGEWHTYPREELFADKEVQTEVMDAYEGAFKVTPVLLRYPVGEGHDSRAPNASRRFGYHDDSFAWATLDTGRKGDEWFYVTSLKMAGSEALDKWKTQPIGGEIRPEAWGTVFDERPDVKGIQDFQRCVQETHATWVMDSGMFTKSQDPVRRKRAEEAVQRMGYEFHVLAATIGEDTAGTLPVVVELENRGVAPFYYEWPVEFGLVAGGKLTNTIRGTGKLTGLLPGDPPRRWSDTLDVKGVAPGRYRLAVRVTNPLPKGRPVRFANKSQDVDISGWLTLGEFQSR